MNRAYQLRKYHYILTPYVSDGNVQTKAKTGLWSIACVITWCVKSRGQRKDMKHSKGKLSLTGSREPFGKVTQLEQIPSALFEILTLARSVKTPEGKQIVSLIDDVITVALADPEAWLKLQNPAEK
jgi:hypothetical protein